MKKHESHQQSEATANKNFEGGLTATFLQIWAIIGIMSCVVCVACYCYAKKEWKYADPNGQRVISSRVLKEQTGSIDPKYPEYRYVAEWQSEDQEWHRPAYEMMEVRYLTTSFKTEKEAQECADRISRLR